MTECALLALTVLRSLTIRFMPCREVERYSRGSLRPGAEALGAALGSVIGRLCYLEQGVCVHVFRSNFSTYHMT